MSDLAVGVVGVGSMGEHHARILSDLDGARLVGVSDRDTERAAVVADEFDADALDLDALLARADAVSVVVPTSAHADLTTACIDAGVHALVEKPFVENPERGRALAERADDAGVILQVGHVERFNPVVDAVHEQLSDGEVLAARADRLCPPPNRRIPDSVVLDLMIHDVDVLCTLFDETPHVIGAAAAADGEYATATLDFDGLVATLSASRVSHDDGRTLAVTTPDSTVSADYATQSVTVSNGTDRDLGVAESDPLSRELASFVDACRTDSDPVVGPDDALRAVEVCREIERIAGLRDDEKRRLDAR